MAGFLHAGLATSLRHNVTSLWLRSLLCCPSSSNVLGTQDAVGEILNDKSLPTLGVATPAADHLLHSFVARQDDFQWFEFWTRERRLWWKRHSNNRLRFDAERVDVDHSRIMYQNKHVVETITKEYHGETALIRNEVDLNAAVKWLLDDACSENNANSSCTRLHYELVPYQASVTVASDELRPRAEEIIGKLKKMQVRCLPIVGVAPELTTNTFRGENQLGVFYNVYLGADVMDTSVAYVRNRDTATAESMYFNEVPYEVARYLKTSPPTYAVTKLANKKISKNLESDVQSADTSETPTEPVDVIADAGPVKIEESAPEEVAKKVAKRKNVQIIKVVKNCKVATAKH